MSNSNSSLTIRVGVSGARVAMSELKALGASLGGLVTRLAAVAGITGFGYAMQKAVREGIEFQATVEQQTIAFKALLGNLDAAKARIQSLTKFAVVTPYQLKEVINANRLLQTLTGGALATEEGMRLVGDAAAAAGRSFEETAMWIGRLYAGLSSGTGVGEATMRLLEMGLVSGQTKLKLDKMAQSGQGVGHAMEIVRDMFKKTSGAMVDQSRTFNGLMSTFKDGIQIMLGQAVDPLFVRIKELLSALANADWEAWGMKAGAFVSLVIDQWKAGKIGDLISLTVQAGFEEGEKGLSVLWEKVKAAFSSNTAKLIGATFAISFTREAAKAFVDFSVWLGQLLSNVASTVVEALLKALNSIIAYINRSSLSKLFGTLKPLGGESPIAAEIAAWNKQIAAGGEVAKSGIDAFFQPGLDAARQLYGAKGATEHGESALKRLNALLDEYVQKRKAEQAAIAKGTTAEVKGDQEAFDVKKYLSGQELELKNELLAKNTELAKVEGDYTKTTAQKYAEKNKLLSDERDLLQQLIDNNNKLIQSPGTSDTDRQLLLNRNTTYSSQLGGINNKIAGLGPNPYSFKAQFTATFTQLGDEWGTWATQMAHSFAEVFHSALSSISDGITGLIMGTKSWGQALKEISNTILTTIVQSIVQMGVQWVMTHVLMRGAMTLTHALGTALGWSQVSQSNAQEAAKAPALAANAASASVGSWGMSAIAGTAAAIAAIGLITAAALGAFAEGGFTGAGGKYDVAGLVHRGEFVMPADAVNRIGIPTLEAMRQGAPASASPRSSGGTGGVTVNVGVLDSRQEHRDFMRREGYKIVASQFRKRGNRVRA